MDETYDASIDLRLPHSVRAPGLARDALSAVRPHLSPDRFSDLQLLVSELVTNSVRHGRSTGTVRLRVAVTDEVARVEVEDDGEGFTVPVHRAGPWEESGRGLAIVQTLADRWGVASSRPTKVWFQIGRPGSS